MVHHLDVLVKATCDWVQHSSKQLVNRYWRDTFNSRYYVCHCSLAACTPCMQVDLSPPYHAALRLCMPCCNCLRVFTTKQHGCSCTSTVLCHTFLNDRDLDTSHLTRSDGPQSQHLASHQVCQTSIHLIQLYDSSNSSNLCVTETQLTQTHTH